MTRKILLAAFAAASMSAFPVSGEDRLPGKSSFDIDTENLYELFRDPAPQYRLYARWWWNGLRLDENEILRELDIMKEMGLGGVEINSIRFPDEADTLGYKVMPYLSDDWARMVRVAADGCRDRGMVCDMIGGSGWPFGGEFLPREHQLQMLTVETQKVDGGSDGTVFTVSRDEILRRVDPPIMSRNSDPAKELMYIRLMPPSNITTKQDTTATLGPRPSSSGRLMSGRTRIRGKVMSASPTISGWTPLRTCRPR